jgi:MFS family permease
MSLLRALRPSMPILIGASVMLSLAMGLRQSLGMFMPPLTRDIGISVSDFTLAIAVQNLAWGFLQPLAGAWATRLGMRRLMVGGALLYILGLVLLATPRGWWRWCWARGWPSARRWPATAARWRWRRPRDRCRWRCAARCWASSRPPARWVRCWPRPSASC